ncbi:MAG: UDP-N-acetylmuramoyl-L-alanine--D-glutamate ligase [Bacillota bacterium]|nr:UDP-N-acetylmuramoyl-L-alanine--D-glutamate ligase [Bacillota bacterium]
MDIKGQKILVIGLAVSGIPTVQVLSEMGARIMVNDRKKAQDLEEGLKQLSGIKADYVLGEHPVRLAEWPDFAVISPGVPPGIPLVQELIKKGKEVISEVELSFRLMEAPVVAITGTNGKTTTTALTGQVFKESGRNTYVVGNIGKPIISVASSALENDVVVAEISSFQLEGIAMFRPKSAAILNITPDHLDRHGTFQNYVDAKARIFENQDQGDFLVLNADDEVTAGLGHKSRARVVHFSRRKVLEAGSFVQDGYIVVGEGNAKEKICLASELRIPGTHNLENALAAAALGWTMGVPFESIEKALKSFEGVEHRLERVDVVNGVSYINDSKGTNPDASIKAIQAVEKPIILIAGGYDKGSSYEEFVKNFDDKVKAVVLLGETAEKIKKTCQNNGFNNIYIVDSVEEAVNCASGMAVSGDTVLLSPACASWDMFRNFEERGEAFKKAVQSLRRIQHE